MMKLPFSDVLFVFECNWCDKVTKLTVWEVLEIGHPMHCNEEMQFQTDCEIKSLFDATESFKNLTFVTTEPMAKITPNNNKDKEGTFIPKKSKFVHVKVVDVHPDADEYEARENWIGTTGHMEKTIDWEERGWVSGYITFNPDERHYFGLIKVEEI